MTTTPKKKLTKLTIEKKQKFLSLLAEYGNVSKAAEDAGLNRTMLYEERNKNPEFKAGWEEAEKVGVAALEDEARRRAFDGWDEPIYYKGDVCGTVRKFSDTLLIFLLKGHKPDKYRDNVKIEHSGGLNMSSEACEDKAKKAAQERLKELQAQNDTHAL